MTEQMSEALEIIADSHGKLHTAEGTERLVTRSGQLERTELARFLNDLEFSLRKLLDSRLQSSSRIIERFQQIIENQNNPLALRLLFARSLVRAHEFHHTTALGLLAANHHKPMIYDPALIEVIARFGGRLDWIALCELLSETARIWNETPGMKDRTVTVQIARGKSASIDMTLATWNDLLDTLALSAFDLMALKKSDKGYHTAKQKVRYLRKIALDRVLNLTEHRSDIWIRAYELKKRASMTQAVFQTCVSRAQRDPHSVVHFFEEIAQKRRRTRHIELPANSKTYVDFYRILK
jgi:hypothetical protein